MKKKLWFKHKWITKKIAIRWWPVTIEGWILFGVDLFGTIYLFNYATQHATSDAEFAEMFLGPFLVLMMISFLISLHKGESIK